MPLISVTRDTSHSLIGPCGSFKQSPHFQVCFNGALELRFEFKRKHRSVHDHCLRYRSRRVCEHSNFVCFWIYPSSTTHLLFEHTALACQWENMQKSFVCSCKTTKQNMYSCLNKQLSFTSTTLTTPTWLLASLMKKPAFEVLLHSTATEPGASKSPKTASNMTGLALEVRVMV